MAKNLFRTFLESTQGATFHESPKTIAIVDTAAFVVFQSAWEALCTEMTSLLQGNHDPDFVANLKLARTKAVSFSGMLDETKVKVKAAMDIGSFLQVFNSFCNPVSSSQLRTLLDNASAAYSAMFVEAGVGEGTPAGTGMHISWVSQDEYVMFTSYYQPILFGETTDELPNYLVFLSTFYDTPTPDEQPQEVQCVRSDAVLVVVQSLRLSSFWIPIYTFLGVTQRSVLRSRETLILSG
jgi:hypothetical protein